MDMRYMHVHAKRTHGDYVTMHCVEQDPNDFHSAPIGRGKAPRCFGPLLGRKELRRGVGSLGGAREGSEADRNQGGRRASPDSDYLVKVSDEVKSFYQRVCQGPDETYNESDTHDDGPYRNYAYQSRKQGHRYRNVRDYDKDSNDEEFQDLQQRLRLEEYVLTQPTQLMAQLSPPPVPPVPQPTPDPLIHPIDARRVQIRNDKEGMDVDPPQAAKCRPPGKNKGTSCKGGERTRAVPQQSEASAQVKTKAVLEDILSTTVQFPLWTILGSPKEILHALQEYIWPQN
ncbi:hypothetical protein CPB83DRAFT_840888 [Crepidotus variabilis]|uniref:Uncharacterized protein n=1 Tax=Crepidotus variabilis TaxID=179855 RepID=A0A9P6E3N2_9AGAR|nr:hypothetical protein CPB83DRAFT_840888 [Crepidotus variabilis]